jgi:hypothetical protein
MLPLVLCASVLAHGLDSLPGIRARLLAGFAVQSPSQLAELTSSDGICDFFGYSVAIDGDTVAVGVPFYDPNGLSTGAVYVFVKGSNGWSDMTQVARLTPSDAGTDYLGQAVAIRGGTIVAGGYGYTVGSNTWQGALYVFTRPTNGWSDMTETARLTASDSAADDQMGHTVAMTSDTVVTTGKGAAYVFTMPAGGWVSGTQTAKLTASQSSINLLAIAIDNDTIVAGDETTSNKGRATGAAFVFVKPANGWTDMSQTAVLTPSDGTKNGYFGHSVAVASDTIVVGSSGTRDGSVVEAGAVYVFAKPTAGWKSATQTAKLTAAPAKKNNELGWSVATNGSLIVAGAIQETELYSRGPGLVYLFSKPATGWIDGHESAILQSSDAAIGDLFGWAVSLRGSSIVVGAPGKNAIVGAAYVF